LLLENIITPTVAPPHRFKDKSKKKNKAVPVTGLGGL
jgi:hypothetical protein